MSSPERRINQPVQRHHDAGSGGPAELLGSRSPDWHPSQKGVIYRSRRSMSLPKRERENPFDLL